MEDSEQNNAHRVSGTTGTANALSYLTSIHRDTPMLRRAVAEIFGCTERTIRNRVRRGELPAPAQMGAEQVWTAGVILSHIRQRVESAGIAMSKHRV